MTAVRDVVLEVSNLVRHYRLPRPAPWKPAGVLPALDGVSFRIEAGRTLGIVGESGSGKSTLARTVMALEPPTSGHVRILGCDPAELDRSALMSHRRHFQMVFQDPYGSLDPRQTVGRIVAEPLSVLPAGERPAEPTALVGETLAAVGLKAADQHRYPHEFSGGQRQRIAIARALVTRPRLIVADEPVSALDVSVQAQVLNLLVDLQDQFGLAYMLISHDLGVIEHMCDDVAVLYRGQIVEQGPAGRVFGNPRHPYTKALRDAVPLLIPGRRRDRLRLKTGPAELAETEAGTRSGCAFADRCPLVSARCRVEVPALRLVAPDQRAACHFA